MDIEKFKAYLESPEGKADLDKELKDIAAKAKLDEGRFRRFEDWLKNNDFDKLLYRLILEHGEEWREKCWYDGFEVSPNNKLSFVIQYITENHAPVKVNELDCVFANSIWQFKGYYFQMIWGQGVITKIFNKDDLRELLTI